MKKIKRAPATFETREEMKNFVLQCENDFENRLAQTAKNISETPNLKVITLSGPTCSGKTTAANKIISELETHGKKVNIISIDDFYFDREYLQERMIATGSKEIDYDSVHTIDLEAFGQFTEKIFKGGNGYVKCPIYDFKTGHRDGYKEIESDENSIFLFEGIQAIYPQVTALLEEYGYCSASIAPRSFLEVGNKMFVPNEIRFLRRIVRDYNFRATSADFTFEIWNSVRRNEEISIFPYRKNSKYRIDSTFGYEIGMLKPYLVSILTNMPSDSKYHREAAEILTKIDGIDAIPKEYTVKNSLYNEFI